jgi:hypothetical protein
MGFSSYFSGQLIYDPMLDTLYNILFTAYPIGWFATYDKELNYDKLELEPILYEIGMSNKYFNVYIFWRWYVYAFTAGLIIYWQTSNIFIWAITNDYEIYDLWSMGTAILFCIVFVVNLKILIATNTHNLLSVTLIIFSTGSFIVCLFFFDKFPTLVSFHVWTLFIHSSIFFLTMLLIIASAMLCEYAWRSVHYIIEEIIIKRVAQKKSKSTTSSSSRKIDLKSEDGRLIEYEVRLTSSINNNNISEEEKEDKEKKLNEEGKEKENKMIIHETEGDLDQDILYNKHRKCIIFLFIILDTGFAYTEDVANLKILDTSIKENFFDFKFNH